VPFDLAEHPTEVQQQIDGLPDDARPDFDAAVAFILESPSASPPYRRDRPEGPLRRRSFGLGLGLIVYQVRYDDLVQLELVQWLG
jgi:hypothetical protein